MVGAIRDRARRRVVYLGVFFVTEYQQTALKFPCYFACETASSRFAHSIPLGSLVLTVNSGYE